MKVQDIVGRKLSRSNRMLVTEAYNRGINFEILPKKRFKMMHGGKSYLVKAGKVSHAYNSRLAIRTMGLKNVTNSLFRNGGFPAPENAVFSEGEVDRAWDWAKPILPIVLKPHNGTMGKLVFVKIDHYDEFKQCFEKITEKHNSVLIERFIEGKEYRFTFVKNEVVAVANRIPANVVGDGEHNIKQLIDIKNEEREKRKNPIHKKLALDEESIRVLNRQGHSIDYVPKESEMVYLRDNSNISTGGDAIDVTDEISDGIKKMVSNAIKSIPGLKVCGVDVLINGDSVHILEVNPHPMFTIHHYPWVGKERDVIGKVIDGMFPKTASSKSEVQSESYPKSQPKTQSEKGQKKQRKSFLTFNIMILPFLATVLLLSKSGRFFKK